jgi:hypothetical protein
LAVRARIDVRTCWLSEYFLGTSARGNRIEDSDHKDSLSSLRYPGVSRIQNSPLDDQRPCFRHGIEDCPEVPSPVDP